MSDRRLRRRSGSWRPGYLARGAGLLVMSLCVAATLAFPSAALAQPAGLAGASVVVPPAGSSGGSSAIAVAQPFGTAATVAVAPLRVLRQADLIVVARAALPVGALSAVRRLSGVAAAEQLDAAKIMVNGTFVAMIGVNPSSFRAFAAHAAAVSTGLWQNVAAGGVAVSYTMGREDHVPLPGTVHVAGSNTRDLPVAGFATVGIGGVDAVVSHQTALSLGLPAGNAILVSATGAANIASLARRIQRIVPPRTAVQQLVFEVAVGGAAVASPAIAGGASAGVTLTGAQETAVLDAALSRRGMPYVWGAEGPAAFDCSGLVQWSFAQAGIVMPRVAADQARTGPLIPFSQAQPGDLLFWRTDPTAPDYISHVAIYLGGGWMIQAPQPGQYVEVVPVVFGAGFAGVVAVHPRVAATVGG